MANGTFFVSWELWQQMTFVLAMGIVFVFLVGLMKLWWMNRHMKKIEELDAEKQVRTAQIRRSGLPTNNRRSRVGSEIPFGVKALESGVEVDGVWVARMASLASQPPGRKWTSKRKMKTPALNVDDAGSSGGLGRGSVRAGRITRREIVKPSTQTGKKLESLPIPEGELQSNGSGANHRQPVNHMDHEEAKSPTHEGRGGQSGHLGPLGRIQRSLKKMTSSESWNEQQKKQLGGQEAIEFRINAQARKPRRFYPQSATPTAPVRGMPGQQSIPQRRSSLHSNSDRSPAEAATSGRGGVSGTQPTRQPTTAPRSHEPRHQTSRSSSISSVESFSTSIEELKEFAPRSRPPPLEHHPVFSSSDLTQASGEELTLGRRRSRRSSQRGHARHSSSEDRSTIHDQQQPDAASQSAPATALRYPPNSSRSAAYIQQPRPQSFASDQQPRTIGGTCSAAQPSPTFGPSDSYINTSTRKVNSNFEILPAGTFRQPEQHAPEEPASTCASVRSSFESQRSGRRKLQKKRTSSSYSK
ncbi:hypothetical protein LA080_011301 [Diaporthe eres]|uniref:Uncharacterized protein n=1 Tax=Diaporthe vaccinii TaxID=105482 RepID=A0ABR4EDZ2_9PEZI|nr:hypothetical protein LA080_011301 [Diaporthe eres]